MQHCDGGGGGGGGGGGVVQYGRRGVGKVYRNHGR